MLLGLFTPDWIVKYLVDNSLGEVIKNKKIQDIKFLDPCQGTGNILIYAFDLLYQKYADLGIEKEDSIYNILTKNLYGIDIDETACLITKLVLILKASQIITNIFDKNWLDEMNISCIKNSNDLDEKKYGEIVKIFKDADEFGSLLKFEDNKELSTYIIQSKNYKINENESNESKLKDNKSSENKSKDNRIKDLVKQYEILTQKYDVVCTNPPYMGKKNINNKLSKFLKEKYPDTKSEMYAAFIERCIEFTDDKGYLAMITIHSWMFISSFKTLRKKILERRNSYKYASFWCSNI